MKRILSLTIVLALAVACTFALASCGGHTHSFAEEWVSDDNSHWHAATCEHTDEKSSVGAHEWGTDNKCTVCDKEKPAEHTHTYASAWSSDAAMHWHAATCEHTDAKGDVAAHAWGEDGKCSVCAYEPAAHTTHIYNYDEYVSDENGHWYASTCCNEGKDGYGAHTVGTGNVCTVCGYETAHEHTYSSAWESDAANHWNPASCGHDTVKPGSLAAHTYNADYECTVCGWEHEHSFDFASGYAKDAEGHWYASSCGHDVKGSFEEHIFTGDFVCASCSYKHNHTFANTLSYDTTGHWYAASCGHDAKKDYAAHTLTDGECACGYSEEVKSIYEIIDTVAPTKVVTVIEYKTAKGDELNGEFTTLLSGNNMILTYSYQMFSSFDDALEGDDRIKTVAGAVYYRDGLYSEDGFEWSAEAPSDVEVIFEFASELLLNPVISEDGNSLTAELTPANALVVFGSDLEADGNIALSIETNSVNLFRIVASAETKSGADVTVKTSYTYNSVSLEYPDGIGSTVIPDDADTLEEFQSAISNTAPNSASISTSLLTVHSDEAMKGLYDVTYNADGTVTVKYAYMKLNAIGEGDGLFSTVTGTATIDAEGNVTGDVEGTVVGAAAIVANLDADKMEYTISAGVLTATVEAADVEAVLGVDTGADTVLTITVVGGNVLALTITYTSAAGPVEIVCGYN